MGLDCLHLYLLKKLASGIATLLEIIYKKSYNTGTVPTVWKNASITLILKKEIVPAPQIIAQ